MNIPNLIHFRINRFIKKDKVKKFINKFSKIHFREDKPDEPDEHVQKVSKQQYEHGDPHFVDERTKCELPKKKESFLSSIFD